jgi:hypothetical protein
LGRSNHPLERPFWSERGLSKLPGDAEKNHIHQNVVCDVIDLNPGTENNFVHHNVVEDIVDDGTDNKLKKNDDSGCPV